jgi:glycosyltransferase involved in cell wall biosynthesis
LKAEKGVRVAKAGSERIHVYHLIGSTGLYGAERWVLALMRAVDPDRVRCTLVNLVDQQGERSEVVRAAGERGLEAFDFPTGGKFNPLAAFRLARLARSQKVDIIQGHGFKSDLVGLLAARLAGCKAMTTPHGWSFEADRKLQLYEKLDRALFGWMDMVCPLSPDLAQEINSDGARDNVRLIFNGVDLEEIQAIPAAPRQADRAFSLGYVGQLIDRKNLDTLLAAVQLLRSAQAEVRLTVIGSGTREEQLREESVRLGIQDRVSFLGFRPDAAAYLKTFDAFVLPSLMEGIPRCIMEALACALPVVVTDIPGNRDLVQHKLTGLLFAPRDSQDLAHQVRYLMENPVLAREMGERGRCKVEAEFSNRTMAAQYSDLYRALLGAAS